MAGDGYSVLHSASGAATASSERRSESMARKRATTAAASIRPPPRAYPMLVEKNADGTISKRVVLQVRFVPMTGKGVEGRRR